MVVIYNKKLQIIKQKMILKLCKKSLNLSMCFLLEILYTIVTKIKAFITLYFMKSTLQNALL